MAASISAGLRTCNFCKCFHLFKRQMKNDICFLKFKRTYKSFSITVDQDKQLVLEIGHMAKFADGSVVAKYGDTSVLVAITSRTEGANTASFLPLTVDYRQKSAAAGRIPTNHLRKELGPTDKEILTGRVIDRSLRALFPADYFYETQITCNLLSVDGVNDPDVVSINAASAALTLSNIPWNGPVGSVRVSCDPKGEFIINPTRKQQNTSSMNVVITTDQQENVVMLEGDAENVPYETFGKGVIYGAKYAANIAKMIAEIEPNKPAKRSYKPAMQVPDKMIEMVESIGAATINDIMYDTSHDKISRDKAINMARNSIVGTFFKDHPDEDKLMMHEAVSLVIRKLFRSQILVDSKRCDGRQLTEVRPISCSVDLFKPLHGSALFQRGQTQVLSTVTFDSLQASLKVDPMSVVTGEMKEKNFLLHYEFPSYATNEIKVPGTKTRRELGHGALAEKGLRPVLPDKFPFSIRLSCEVLESNGSSSMASICSGSLALMDAGVQISQPAAGVAIGLVASPTTQNEKKYILLSDIMGIEDYMGDMDFKIGGTWSGVTAVQMDLKIPGIPVKVLLDALDRAKTNIQHILVQMLKGSIAQPRPTFKPNGPVIEQINVPPAKRANFIGIGGLNVRKLQSETGVQLTTIDESNFQVFAPNQDAMNEAKEMMNTWLEAKKEPELEFNAVYDAKIVELKDIGVMVQIHPAMNPVLLHNKQLDHRKFFGKANVKFSFHTWGTLSVECIDSFPCVECKLPVDHPSVLGFEVGQTISVKYFGRDPVTGKIRISRKVISGLSTDRFKFMQEET